MVLLLAPLNATCSGGALLVVDLCTAKVLGVTEDLLEKGTLEGLFEGVEGTTGGLLASVEEPAVTVTLVRLM